jgi:hypothetical protein
MLLRNLMLFVGLALVALCRLWDTNNGGGGAAYTNNGEIRSGSPM